MIFDIWSRAWYHVARTLQLISRVTQLSERVLISLERSSQLKWEIQEQESFYQVCEICNSPHSTLNIGYRVRKYDIIWLDFSNWKFDYTIESDNIKLYVNPALIAIDINTLPVWWHLLSLVARFQDNPWSHQDSHMPIKIDISIAHVTML